MIFIYHSIFMILRLVIFDQPRWRVVCVVPPPDGDLIGTG
ncbi:hypothetical protein V6Z11_1Z132100 [Gossypium hirsutum]